VFLYGDQVLGFGYYWEGDDPLRALTVEEENQMLSVARAAALQVGVPFIIVDVGQVTNGEWIVIEVGDAQFAGASQTPLIALWMATRSIEDTWQPPPGNPYPLKIL
jgi:hypothetical protein